MKKNIANILQKGNIKPSDRVKLLVADMASKERDGKALLTEADKHALREGWTPKSNEEVIEFNRFNEGWKNIAYAEMDAQTTYLQATNNFLRASKYISYILYKTRFTKETKAIKEDIANNAINSLIGKYDIETIKDTIEGEALKDQLTKDNEALNLVLDYLGLELDYTIYLYAFELAGEELQKDLLALYPNAQTEKNYLEQEEIIYNFFNSKGKLNQTDKEELAELIADECFNKVFNEFNFSNYFANLPLIEVGKRLANESGLYKELKADTEADLTKELPPKLTAYAEKHNTTTKELLKDTIIKWLDDGLFTKEFTPLYLSEDKATVNEQDTKLTHKEVFKKWLEVKAKATETIQELIDKGELKTAKRTREFKKIKEILEKKGQDRQDTPTETKTIITGESLYNFKGDYQFIKDFKRQAEDFKIFGALVLFLNEHSFVKDYSTLLAFELLFKELSKTFETDLTYSIKKWIGTFKHELEMLKIELLMLADDITQANYKADRVYYLNESYLEDLLTMPFDPDKVKPDMDGRIKVYAEKIKDVLEDDFKNPFDYEK